MNTIVKGREAEGLLKDAIAAIEPEIVFIESFSEHGSLLLRELCSGKDDYLSKKARKVVKLCKDQELTGDQVLDLICGVDVVVGVHIENRNGNELIVKVGIDLTINSNTSVLTQKSENLMRSFPFLRKKGIHKVMVLLWKPSPSQKTPPLRWSHVVALLKLPPYSIVTI